jgi:hypothetical protein
MAQLGTMRLRAISSAMFQAWHNDPGAPEGNLGEAPRTAARCAWRALRVLLQDEGARPPPLTRLGADPRGRHRLGQLADVITRARRHQQKSWSTTVPAMTTPAAQISPHQAHQRDGTRRQ